MKPQVMAAGGGGSSEDVEQLKNHVKRVDARNVQLTEKLD